MFSYFFGGGGQFGQNRILYMPSYDFAPREKQHKIGDHFLDFSINDLNSHLVFFYRFIFDCAGSPCCEQRLLSRCGAQGSLFWGFSCGAQAVGTQKSGAMACWPWSVDSVVAAYRQYYFVLLPNQFVLGDWPDR